MGSDVRDGEGRGVDVRGVVQVALTALADCLEGVPAARVVEKEAGL